jgi:hypothetical protein
MKYETLHEHTCTQRHWVAVTEGSARSLTP